LAEKNFIVPREGESKALMNVVGGKPPQNSTQVIGQVGKERVSEGAWTFSGKVRGRHQPDHGGIAPRT